MLGDGGERSRALLAILYSLASRNVPEPARQATGPVCTCIYRVRAERRAAGDPRINLIDVLLFTSFWSAIFSLVLCKCVPMHSRAFAFQLLFLPMPKREEAMRKST